MFASLAFMGLLIAAMVLFIYFGPKNPLIGFAFGAGVVTLVFMLGMRFPFLAAAADIRSGSGDGIARSVARMIHQSSDPRGNSLLAARVIGWILALIVGSFALLLAIMAVGMRVQGKPIGDITNAATICGFLSALTFFIWKFIARVGLP